MVTLATEASSRVKVFLINFTQRNKQPGDPFPSKVTWLLLHTQNSLQQLNQSPLGKKISVSLLNWFLKGRGETKVLSIFNWSIVDLLCCVNFCCIAKWLIYTYTYTFFFIFFSIIIYPRILNIVPCAMQRALLFIYSTCNSLQLLTPDTLSISSTRTHGSEKYVFCVCESIP